MYINIYLYTRTYTYVQAERQRDFLINAFEELSLSFII